ncbi:hypothetical protein AK88_05089 [Plasmodium fragile]|uniref:PPIase cyclophilin-type domain-containing protein n=1 Tax=Plasmodium fragile TaxID=5857 RepID=A0A0D9QE48_PLAFR|nr:uncharacterized protein AK88_05089 [Plasmodium fragile]KJP85278.1 hypothetical protein AK88_05089 [Plasmodium fragile]
MGKKKYVYLQLSMNSIVLGKVYIQLFDDAEVKNSVENFLSLCRGNKYHSVYSGEPLSYKHCIVEKVKKNKCIKSGYLRCKVTHDTSGQIIPPSNRKNNEEKYEQVECIFGPSYKKENSQRRHTNAGLLTMVQVGPKRCSSVFKITLNAVNKYNGKNTVIGRVVKNMHILRAIELMPVTSNFQPKVCIYVSECNEVSESFFKGERVSSRQQYIDSLFANAANASDGSSDDSGSAAAGAQGNHKDPFRKILAKGKKGKTDKTEKQKGVELLNRILSDIDALSRGEALPKGEALHKGDVLHKGEELQKGEEVRTVDAVKTTDAVHKADAVKKADEAKSLPRKMTDRQKRFLEIELKINQSKGLNEVEATRERLTGHLPTRTTPAAKTDEYACYHYEQNASVTNACGKRPTPGDGPGDPPISDDDKPNGGDDPPSSSDDKEEAAPIYTTSAAQAKSVSKKKNKKDLIEVDRDKKFFKKMKFNFSINRNIYDEQKKKMGKSFYGHDLLMTDASKCTDSDKNKVINFCRKQQIVRSTLSRKRNKENEVFKNYINRRNKMYNKKLDRYFNQHTAEIRQNLERGG